MMTAYGVREYRGKNPDHVGKKGRLIVPVRACARL